MGNKKKEYEVSLEKEVARKRVKGIFQKVVLTTIFTAGLITVSAVAPNSFRFFGRSINKAKLKYKTKNTLSKLIDKGFVEFTEKRGKKFLQITERGRVALALAFEKPKLDMKNKKKRWDGKWRIVIFDIAEKRRGDRDKLRKMMKRFGFFRLQDSVWIYPYNCEGLITLLKADLEVGKSVLYAIVEKLEYDKPIKKLFGFKI